MCINLGTFFCLLKVSDLILYKCSQCWTKIGYVQLTLCRVAKLAEAKTQLLHANDIFIL